MEPRPWLIVDYILFTQSMISSSDIEKKPEHKASVTQWLATTGHSICCNKVCFRETWLEMLSKTWKQFPATRKPLPATREIVFEKSFFEHAQNPATCTRNKNVSRPRGWKPFSGCCQPLCDRGLRNRFFDGSFSAYVHPTVVKRPSTPWNNYSCFYQHKIALLQFHRFQD